MTQLRLQWYEKPTDNFCTEFPYSQDETRKVMVSLSSLGMPFQHLEGTLDLQQPLLLPV